jgi:hypothetical protein
MEIVVLEQFGTAETQHVGMHVPLEQFRAQAASALFGFGQRFRRFAPTQLAILAKLNTSEDQHMVQLQAPGFEHVGFPYVTDRLHRFENEPQDVVAASVSLLLLA